MPSNAQFLGYNSIGVNTYPGFLIAHRDDSKNLEAHTLGIEFSLLKKEIKGSWARHYRDPEIALSMMYMNLGQPELTGNVFAILPSFGATLAQVGSTRIRYKAGSGIGYLTRKFDPYNNRRNQAIGSHFNGAMQLFLILEKPSGSGSLVYNMGLGITHFSNGSFRVPNLGVNMPSLHLGISTGSSRSLGAVPKDSLSFKRWKFAVAYAFKERTLTRPRGFHIINISATRLVPRSPVADWRLGSDIFTDKTHHYIDFPGESLKGLKPAELLEWGLYGGHQWLMGRVHFKADIGFYPYKPSKNKFITYQRMGFDVYLNQSLFLTSSLKTHFGIADHFTFGFGYRL